MLNEGRRIGSAGVVLHEAKPSSWLAAMHCKSGGRPLHLRWGEQLQTRIGQAFLGRKPPRLQTRAAHPLSVKGSVVLGLPR